jgi:hypothetical protein
LQIAYLINQLVELLQKVKEGLKLARISKLSLWEDAIATLRKTTLSSQEAIEIFENTRQLRY